ncbi:HAD family hydrolase [Halobacteriales archaeon SW_7_71_33]|nr:MAG: HAD family hydrolase [Halobacteriales archaeon SW_7_71_33]
MRVVLDYGGVLVRHADEREYAHLLGVPRDREPYPGWLAYYLFRAGFLDTQEQYVDLLSTLTGASEADCVEYVERTWLDPDFPAEHRALLGDLAAEHSLVLFSNMAEPWVETVLRRHGVRELFDDLVVSSELGRPKPHPRGYVRCTADADGTVVMVSDEYNEDLLMAECLGMTTVWLRNDDEQPYRRPDHAVDDLAALPGALDEARAER